MKKANVYNYIKVAEYSAKVQTIGNLQEAYKLIESEASEVYNPRYYLVLVKFVCFHIDFVTQMLIILIK